MHPVLTVIEWHGVTRVIGSYGALVTLGLLVGSALTLGATARARLDVGAMISALAGAIGVGFGGAYLAAVLVSWAQTGSLRVSLAQSGIMFYGGAVAGGLGLAGFARVFGLPARRTLDLALPGLPVAHAIGRLGCFFGGCCYGAPSARSWAVLYTDPLAPAAHPSLPRHPWPLYEAGFLLLLAVLYAWPRFAAGAPGRRAVSYVALYAVIRAVLEPLRGDVVRGVFLNGACSVAQIIAFVTAAFALGTFWWRGRSPLCEGRLQV